MGKGIVRQPRPIAWVLATTNHGTMLVNRHDYRMVGNTGFGVGHQLLNTSSFDQPEVDVVLSLLSQRRKHFGDSVIAIDCGANIGVHTVEWARHMHGWGQIIAIEAQERIYYALAGNISINNCFNAKAIWAAVGGDVGTIDVPVPDYFQPSSFGSLELRKRSNTEYIGQDIHYDEAHALRTRLVTIDSLEMPRIDLMKIDIEGMEMEALLGAEQSLAHCKPQLLIEKIKSNESDMTDFLNKMGYVLFQQGINILAIHNDDPTLVAIRASSNQRK
jgi:FkbM family methyltransferase